MFPKLPSLTALLFLYVSISSVTGTTLPRAPGSDSIAGKHRAVSLRDCAIKALGSDAASRLVDKSNAAYDDARMGEKIQYDQFPTLIAYAKSSTEVQELVKCANASGIKAVPRTGGHHFESYSALSDTLVIDIAHIDSVTVASDRKTAVVGAGTRLGRLYLALDAHNTTFVGGICPTVGISGLLASGGFSMVMRSQGLSVDHVQSLKAVDAKGKLVTASASQNSDLFWAMLGGGGGTYAIATEYTLRVSQLPRSAMVFLTWTGYNTTVAKGVAYQVAKRFLEWAPNADPAFTSQVNVYGDNVQVLGWYLGKSKAQLQELLDSSELLNITGQAPTTVAIEGDCNTHNSRLFGYTTFTCQKDSDVNPFIMNTIQDPFSALPDGTPQFTYNETTFSSSVEAAPAWTRFKRMGKSFYVQKDNLLQDKALEEVVTRIQSLDKESQIWGEWHAWNITPNKGTQNAFGWREKAYAHLQFQAHASEDAVTQKGYENWFEDLEVFLRPKIGTASYSGYMDAKISTNPYASYFGGNVCKLVGIKKKYDPQNFFTNPFAITPTTPKGVKC
ncbi:hypothetical protein V492_05054 [Pseudogymnoascus sp. VKM F-4246]|nr:hypothetical protein V492_05054 [Pseudogymnoascus sp. VKM F-4246]